MTKTDWQTPPSVIKFEEDEMAKDEQHMCSRCGEYFTQRSNEQEFKCKVHKNEHEVILETTDAQGKMQRRKLITSEAVRMMNNNSEHYPFMFKYICCGGTYGSKGELSAAHIMP